MTWRNRQCTVGRSYIKQASRICRLSLIAGTLRLIAAILRLTAGILRLTAATALRRDNHIPVAFA